MSKAELKKVTSCLVCGKKGHWKDDPECKGKSANHTEAADDDANDENYEIIIQEQPHEEENDWWDDYNEEEYTLQELADDHQSVYETKADSVQNEAM